MKIKALTSFAGTEASLAEGSQADVSKEFADAMVKAGYAEIVDEQKPAPKKAAPKKKAAE